MSTTCTLSFHMGSRFNEKHNNRTIPVPHANTEYEKEHNWYSPDNMSLEQAYEFFTESFNAYNATVRKDRRCNTSYLEKLQTAQQKEQEKIAELRHSGASASEIRKHRKAVKPAYELIIGLGNMRDNPEFCMGGSMQETANEILQEYIKQFQKENPNVLLYNASIHTGEHGTIHLHADIIFWAECSRGQKKQASLTKALSAMGYESDKEKGADGKRLNAITKWEMEQREILKKLCAERGITIKAGKHSQVHLTTEEFQAQRDSEFVSEQAGQLLAEQDKFIDYVVHSGSAVAYMEHLENEELRQTVSELEAVKQRSDQLIADAWSEFNSATSLYFQEYRDKKKSLYEEIHRARQGAKNSRKYLTAILNDIAYSNDFFIIKLFKLVFAMFVAVESASREREVKRLQEKNQQIKALAKNIVSESQTVGEYLRSKDIENIERILSEYEQLLQNSLIVINSNHHSIANNKSEKNTYEEIL